jgi:hypothetical protein
MSGSNFHFLSDKWNILANLGETAERNVFYRSKHNLDETSRIYIEVNEICIGL